MSDSNGWAKTLRGIPRIGHCAERKKTMTVRDIELFTEITGDRNPLHYDQTLVCKLPFGGLIVQGGVTSGILNAIVAEDIPGPGSVFLGMDLKFSKAVRVGDTVTGRVTIKAVREDKPICTIEVSVVNQHNDFCLSGTATTYTIPLKD